MVHLSQSYLAGLNIGMSAGSGHVDGSVQDCSFSIANAVLH